MTCFLRGRTSGLVLSVMLAGSVLVHIGIFAVVSGFQFRSGAMRSAPSLVSHEFLIDMAPPKQPIAPAVRMPDLKPPPGSALPAFDPSVGKPINVIAAQSPASMPGLPSGGHDVKSLILGGGGVASGHFGASSTVRSFSLGGGTVRANALIILLDASGSMYTDGKLDRARKKIRDLTKQSGVRVMAEIEVPNCAFIQLAEPGADPSAPLDAAYAMSAAMCRYPFADAVYFFSDFQDTVAPDTVEQLRHIATGSEPKVRVYLHTLEKNPDRALTDLCRATGGQVLR